MFKVNNSTKLSRWNELGALNGLGCSCFLRKSFVPRYDAATSICLKYNVRCLNALCEYLCV